MTLQLTADMRKIERLSVRKGERVVGGKGGELCDERGRLKKEVRGERAS